MVLPATPLLSLFASLMVAVMLVRFNVAYLGIVVALSSVAALAMLLVKGRYLPRFLMDILDRLSNKGSLEAAYQQQRTPHVIDAEALAANLKAHVVGQVAVIDQIALQLRRRLAAQRRDKPIAVFCLAGPPGVGKTHLAKVLAETLYGTSGHLQFFDMSQFGQPHAAASLFGQARGYVGSTSYGTLTAALRDRPDSIILLDEFEKAHPEVHKRFLTAWNDGFVTETSDGARIPANEAIFILTTNAASRRIGEIASQPGVDLDTQSRAIKKALLDAQFAPEVLSRIDQVFAFRPLQGLDIARVVALEIEALAHQFGLEIAGGGIDPAILLDAIEELETRMDGGVRDIARAIERRLTDGLIDARGQGATKIRITGDGADVRVVATERPAVSTEVPVRMRGKLVKAPRA